MDKNTFMKELERSLAVLQEAELQDILNEYEQHIDMKVKSGLSEAEAIADFGKLPELVSEILEAYHVRADYVSDHGGNGGADSMPNYAGDRETACAAVPMTDLVSESVERDEKKGRKAVKEWMSRAGTLCGGVGRTTARAVCRIGKWILGVLVFWKALFGKPFVWAAEKWKRRSLERAEQDKAVPAELPKFQEDATVKAAGLRWKSGSLLGKLANLIRGLFSFGIHAVLWGIRMMWNAGWLIFSMICGVCGLCCLFGLGLLAVLLFQGYPIIGIMIGCLGLTGCLFSAAGLGMSFLWRKEKQVKMSEENGNIGNEPGGERYA